MSSALVRAAEETRRVIQARSRTSLGFWPSVTMPRCVQLRPAGGGGDVERLVKTRADMDGRELDTAAREYYAERYDVVVDYEFEAKPPIRLNDHASKDQAARRCRFCGLGMPAVTFKKKAHAVPELLGCKTIRSMNECDKCNSFLAREYEDHLGKWSQFARSVSQVKGKAGAPSYANPSDTMRFENTEGKLSIALTDKSLFDVAAGAQGPFSFKLSTDVPSSTYVPFRAAKALVKIACSVCPGEDLPQCQRAISWLMTGKGISGSNFPVLRGFTPGPPEAFQSKVILLRRKQPGQEPYLWCVLQYLNHRLQFFVPLCPIDDPIFQGGPVTLCIRYYRPPEIPFDWPHGESKYWRDDWSSEEESQLSISLCFNVPHAEVVRRPGEMG